MRAMNRMLFERIVALCLIALPGALGVIGWKWMKDAIYNAIGQQPFSWSRFFAQMFSDWHLYAGLSLFFVAIFFIGGFIFYRDAKRNRVQPRFRKRQ